MVWLLYGSKAPKFGKLDIWLLDKNWAILKSLCLPVTMGKKASLPWFGTLKGKSILQVPDTGTRVLDNTRPFLCSSIVSFWITLACSKERKYHIFRQYWYTKNVPELTNTGTFQYLGPEVYLVSPWSFGNTVDTPYHLFFRHYLFLVKHATKLTFW